jgi:methionyl-tRNA synthetase
VIDDELQSLGNAQKGSAEEPSKEPPSKPPLTIDEFRSVDLRIGRVVSAEAVPKSKKLLKLLVEVGSEQRQIVAGIAQHYIPEDLVGKLVVVVFNLQPAVLMGTESRGMILAASDGQGKLVLISPQSEIVSGSKVQ